MRATHDGISYTQGAALYDDRGEGAATHFDLRLDDDAAGFSLWISFEFHDVCLEQNHV